jgi:hypothetical protein
MKTPGSRTPFTLAVIGLLALMAGSAQGALLLYDGFETYANSSGLNTQNGGTAAGGSTWSAWSTASSGQTAQNAALSYSSGQVSVSGGARAFQSDAGATSFLVSRTFSMPALADGESIYVSYLMRATSGFGGANTFTQVGLVNSNNWGAITRQNGSVTDLGVRVSSSDVFGDADALADAQTYFVVQRYTISGANTSVSVWLNPTSATLGAPNATATGASLPLDSLRFRGALGTATYLFDEVRIGQSVADVVPLVPEPGAPFLLAATALGLHAFTRRRRGSRGMVPSPSRAAEGSGTAARPTTLGSTPEAVERRMPVARETSPVMLKSASWKATTDWTEAAMLP